MSTEDVKKMKALELQASIASLERVKGLIKDDAKYNARRRDAAVEAKRWQVAQNHEIAVDVGFNDALLVQCEIERLRQEILRLAKGAVT